MSTLQRVAITGSSGFYGRALVSILKERCPDVTILGLDIVEPVSDQPDEFHHCDILSDELHNHLEAFQPDTVIHLAFVVNPMRNQKRMRQINIEGTKNLIAAASRIKPARLLVSSSATAYGAWADNPVPITENHPLRARTEYQYAEEKVMVEGMLEKFRDEHPDVAVSWTRPAIIYGKGVDNYLTEFVSKVLIVVKPGGDNSTVQFVHLDDVAEATYTILEANATGAFNIGPPDWIHLTQLAKMKRRPCFPLPFRVCQGFTIVWHFFRLPVFRFPSGLWYFIRYPWVVAPERLQNELNFKFQYSTEETIRQMLQDGGFMKKEVAAEKNNE